MPTDLLTLTRERAQENLFWRYLGVVVEDAGEAWVPRKMVAKLIDRFALATARAERR